MTKALRGRMKKEINMTISEKVAYLKGLAEGLAIDTEKSKEGKLISVMIGILEEIGMYADDPSDLVSEKLSAAVFHGTPLGRPILGRKATLDKMTGAWLKEYKQSHYTADRIIITLAGSFTDEILDEIRARFSVMTPGKAKKLKRVTAQDSIVVKKKATEQNHLLAAFPAITDRDPRKYQMQLLSSILGGGMSSRLFQQVREKNGLCYAIYTYTASFLDCGMFGISAAVGRETEQRALALIRDELERFRTDGVTQSELDRAREQVHASVLMAEESTASRMNKLGYSELYLGRVLPADEVLARYDAVTREDILGLARETLDFDRVSFSAVGRLRPQEEYAQQLRR